MEEKIFEILNMASESMVNVPSKVKKSIAKEISELFKGMYPEEFIWWMNRNLNQYKYEWEKSEVFIYGKWRTLPNLYQYWIENIKDK